MIVIGKDTNIETQNNKKDSQQDTRIDSLQTAVDSLNAQVSAISASIVAINASIDDKYSAQTQTLMAALTSQINALSEALSSVVSTAQVSANIGNFERLSATISANIEQLTALAGNIKALTSEQINAQSVEVSDSVVTDELQVERATITEAILTRVAIETFTITNLVAELLKADQIESEIIKADEVQSGVVKAVNLTGKGWQTPIGTPDNTELLKITIPLYEGAVQVITEGNEFNVSILNNAFIAWTEKSAYLYRIQLTETAIELYLQNIGDTVNYQLLFIGSTETTISTSEIVDKTGIKQNILTFSGYLSISQNNGGTGAQLVIVDVIPEEGEEGVIYFSPVLGAWTFNPNSGETGAMNALSGTELLNAVNANTTHIGNLSTLLTVAKSNLVSAINELYNAIDVIADDVEDLQTDVGTLQNNVGTLQTDVGTLQDNVEDIEADIATINGNDTGLSMREVARDVATGVYTPQGSYLFANLPSLSSTDVKVGYVYDILDDFTTTSDFREGAGIEVPAGTNIVVADVSGSKKWDLLGFNIDLSPYQKKTMSAPVPVGGTPQSTVEGAIGALASLPGPNAYLSTATKTLTGSTLEAGSSVRVMFTADITGTDTTTGLSLVYNGSPIAVKVNKNGSLSNFVAVETSTGVFKYLQAYTVLDLLYDGTQFIINGNPIVLSSTDYIIYANGYDDIEEYSTTEVKTNKVWIDGKPIYRRVLVTTIAFTLTERWSDFCYYCGSPVLDIDTLVNANLTLERGIYIEKRNKDTIYIARPTSDRPFPVGSTMIIEYTKTTD